MLLDLTVFVPRLKQVIAWTAHLAHKFNYQTGNYGTVFRQTNPVINGQPLYTIDGDYTFWNTEVYALHNHERALQAVWGQRDAASVRQDPFPAKFRESGRILYFETMQTTHDGVALIETNCFVDESDVPPLDTWFFLDVEKRNLFCWIPKEFEAIMQKGVDVEIFDSYHWLDEADPLTHQKIVAAMAK